MLVWDIIKFLKEYGEPDIAVGDLQACYDFFFDIINAGQIATVNDEKGLLAGVGLYYKVRRLDEVRRKRGTFQRMRNYRHGNICYVHTVVIRPDYRGQKTIWRIIKEIRERELLCDTVAFTFNKNEKWTYKIERRREKMRDNCGIIALDSLLKSLNLNMSRISLDTLSKMCRDNGRLMFPLKVPKERITSLQFPYIMQTNNHYEVIEDEIALEGADMGEEVYLLYPALNATVIPHVIDEDEAKEVIGAGGGTNSGIFSNKGLVGKYFTPANLIPLAADAAFGLLNAKQNVSTGFNAAAPYLAQNTGFISPNMQMFSPNNYPGESLSSSPATSFAQNQPTYSQFTPGNYFGVTPTMQPATNPASSLLSSASTSMPARNLFGTVNDINRIENFVGAPSPESPSIGANLMKYLPSAALMLGSRLIPQPEYNIPNTADVYKQLMADQSIPMTQGPLGQAAAMATLKNIESPDAILDNYSTPYKEAIISDLNQRESDEIARVRTMHVQNGTSGGSDEMRDIMRVQENYRNSRNQQLGAIEENLYNQKVNIYLTSISQAYGMDQANLQTIAGLTGASINEAAVKYGIKAQQVKDFRDALYELGRSTFPGTSTAGTSSASDLLSKLGIG